MDKIRYELNLMKVINVQIRIISPQKMKLLILICIGAAVAADSWVEIISNRMSSMEKPKHAKVINGTEVEPHSLPFQVGLYITRNDGLRSFCGGTLISQTYVLTAAHCMEEATSIEIVLGAHNIGDKGEETQVRLISTDFRQHEAYDPKRIINDIAYIKLPNSVPLNDAINTIALPSFGENEEDFVNATAYVSGWGKTRDHDATITDKLRCGNLDVIANDVCNRRYFGLIVDTEICGEGPRGQSSCHGDSGGPLFLKDGQGRNKQIGVTSFGIIFGCEKGWPSAFTRVTAYLRWIANNTDALISA